MVSPPAPRTTARQVLGDREFRAMFLAGGLSSIGDQLARIAVALVVLDRSGSAFAAAATYACSYLTWLLGGPVLSTLSDRVSRRRLMITADIGRAALVSTLVLPGVPLWLLFVVLAVVGLLAPPFAAARSALLADVLDGDAYVVGNALAQNVDQAAQVVGFVGGGALVAVLSTDGALLANAATFVLSALLLLTGVRERGRQSVPSTAPLLSDALDGARLVAGSPVLRGLLCWGLLVAAVGIAPEGLAVAINDEAGGGPLMAGILTAAGPMGFLLGSALLIRVPRARRESLFVPLTVLSAAPLLLTPFVGSLVVLAALWVLAGSGNALQLVANAAYVQAVPAHLRGRAFGIAGTALMAIQGVVLLAAGALAEITGPRVPVAVLALLGLALLPAVRRTGRRPAQDLAAAGRRATA